MQHKNKYQPQHDFQDPGVKRAKRVASIIYICVMAFIVGGTYLHQQSRVEANAESDVNAFSNP